LREEKRRKRIGIKASAPGGGQEKRRPELQDEKGKESGKVIKSRRVT